ncbi:hypothetical protein ACFQS2_14415 [Brachybacterium sp. GCM10030267]|uniref:hypothetical protein n=1 Tax=unclassified Brachybacterium TaxID=2623841 RepID=UPI003620B94F
MSNQLAAVREVWAQRDQARTRGDVLYLVYVAALSVLVFGSSALQAAGSALARPDVLPVLTTTAAPQVSTAVTLAAGAALVLLGAVRGPALLAPFFIETLAWSGIRRRAVLWRPFLRALMVPLFAAVVLAALIAVTLLTAGHTTAAGSMWFVVAAVGTGLLLATSWLAGQLLDPAGRRLLAGALAVGAVLTAFAPLTVGLGGAYPVGAGAAGAWALGLLVTGILLTAAGVPLLDRLRGRVLQEQAQRWQSAVTVATSGDLAAAAGTFRLPPSTGRRLGAIGPGPLMLVYARRDAVAWLRSPESVTTGALVTVLAAATLAGSTTMTGPLAWFAVLVGSMGLWAASGPFVDGIRHAVHTLGAPGLFGQSAEVQALLHTVAPALLLAGLASVGGAGYWLIGAGGPGALQAVLLPLALTPVMITGRVRDAAKGPMPLRLITPMPTPQGDASVIPMLAWQSDAVLLAVAAGALTAALGLLGPLWILVAAAGLTGVTGLMARARLRALRT